MMFVFHTHTHTHTHTKYFNGPKQSGTALRFVVFLASLRISRFIMYPLGGFNFRHEMFGTKQKTKTKQNKKQKE